MKVLVVGGGGREHALAWKLAQSPRVSEVLATRPNAGLAQVARGVDVAPADVPALVALAREEGVGLTVVGPEAPLVAGLVDAFEAAGLRVFGPKAGAAALEGSKAFAKSIMDAAGVPTAAWRSFDAVDAAKAWVREFGRAVAVKADGLAAGKGVVLCDSARQAEAALDRMMADGAFGDAGRRVVVEELLVGQEASFIAVCSGLDAVALATSQDHKRIGEGDTGPNTGGMGAYSPAPCVTAALHDEVMATVIRPTLKAMADRGTPFTGFLYAGLMLTADGPRVLEFNVRLGDPETQPLMMRLASDLVPLFDAAIDGDALPEPQWHPGAAMGVVLASAGYPESSTKGDRIEGLGVADAVPGVTVFHAGTRSHAGDVLTDGGRVLCVTARGGDHRQAATRAYEACAAISWPGLQMRRDIGWRVLGR